MKEHLLGLDRFTQQVADLLYFEGKRGNQCGSLRSPGRVPGLAMGAARGKTATKHNLHGSHARKPPKPKY